MPFKNREKRLEYMRGYYLAHREEVLAQKRAEYEADPEKYIQLLRARRAAHPEKTKESNDSRLYVCGMYLGRI